MRTNFIASILCFLFLSVTPLLAVAENANENLNSHIARVTAPRAIVYSDESMNSPLGYISNDKLITVGNPRIKNPELVPLIIYGRIAFIESKNIHFENDAVEKSNSKRGAPREHNVDILLAKPEEKLSENNSAYFGIHQFSAGAETKDLFATIDGADKEHFIGFDASLIHRQIAGKFYWGAGYEYDALTSSNIDFKLYLIRPILGYTPIRTSLFLIDLNFALDLSLATALNIKTNQDNEPTGFLYGPNLSAKVVFFPDLKYHFYGGMGYRNYKVLRYENVSDANENLINGIQKISGVDLYAGIGINF